MPLITDPINQSREEIGVSAITGSVNEAIEDYLITRTSEFMEKASSEGKQISPETMKFFMKQWVLDYKIMN